MEESTDVTNEEETVMEGLTLNEDERPIDIDIDKKTTKPWSQEDNPWATDIFKLKHKRQGFRVRFVDPNLLTKRRDEGWQVADCKDYKIIREEDQLDSTVTRRGLILMEMLEELAQQREAYFKHKTELQSRDAKQMAVTDTRKLQKKMGNHKFDLSELD